MDDPIPPFLTVEQAAALLKIGRTKAYLLTQEYRATDGRSGLPVVDLGDVLRVPGPAIERMLGIGLDAALPDPGEPARLRNGSPARPGNGLRPGAGNGTPAPVGTGDRESAADGAEPPPIPAAASVPGLPSAAAGLTPNPVAPGSQPPVPPPAAVSERPAGSSRSRRRPCRPVDQLPLFEPLTPSNPNTPTPIPNQEPNPTTTP